MRKRLAVLAAETEWAEVEKERAVVEKQKVILEGARLDAMITDLF